MEAQHINRSLSALGDVMAALAAKERHVPYRNSKLTQLLQDSLAGQAKVMMFMHVAPESSSHGESVSTLKFATRVSEITLGAAKRNVVSGKVFEAQEAVASRDAQLTELNAALADARERAGRAEREASRLAADNDALRGALDAARASAAAVGAGTAPGSGGPMPGGVSRAQLQLPLAQLLGGNQPASALPPAPGTGRASLGGAAGSAAAGGEAAAAGGGVSITDCSPLSSRPPRAPVDRTPPRDQDVVPALLVRSVVFIMHAAPAHV